MPDKTTVAGELPELPQGWPAKFRCDSCDGTGEVGEPQYQGHFQPPERARCPDCNGSGIGSEEPGYSASDMRAYATAALAQKDGEIERLRAALESVWLWMENQADGQSKGGHATFDLMALREQREAARAALGSQA